MKHNIKLVPLLIISINIFGMLSKKEVDEFHPYWSLESFVIETATNRINNNDFDTDKIIKNIMEKSLKKYVHHEKQNLFIDKLNIFFGLSENEASKYINLSIHDTQWIENSINSCIHNYIEEEDKKFKEFFNNEYQEKIFGDQYIGIIQIDQSKANAISKIHALQNIQKTLVTKHIKKLFKKTKKLIKTYEEVFLDTLKKELYDFDDLNNID